MYNPAHFRESRGDVLDAFLLEHPLGLLITNGDGLPEVTHLPFHWDRQLRQLRCHMARANPHWRSLAGARVLVVFSGESHYISPGWYASKQGHGMVVPTWNYLTVHATGAARLFEDEAALVRHVSELTGAHERRMETPWQVTDAPEGYIGQLTKAIVGIEIAVEGLEGKWKASQNRPLEDRRGVIAGLQGMGTADAAAMARRVAAAMEKPSGG